MMYRVVITRRAEREMHDAAHWWATNRSPGQAARWLAALEKRLKSLAKAPSRFPLAAEHLQFPYEVRELHYGLRGRITHRAVFTIADDIVLVLSVRHAAQDQLHPEELD
jgi:plasmid stabilization system protein ParE